VRESGTDARVPTGRASTSRGILWIKCVKEHQEKRGNMDPGGEDNSPLGAPKYSRHVALCSMCQSIGHVDCTNKVK
jgi:hypothetical protein